jgi:hypothetical protein
MKKEGNQEEKMKEEEKEKQTRISKENIGEETK